MNKFKSLIYLIIGFLFVLFGCKASSYLNSEYKENTSKISADGLGNLYKVIGNKLSKITNKNDSTLYYSNLNNGSISEIDTRNSLEIMLFFKEQQTIIMLDNSLAKTSEISLISQNFPFVDLVCLSNRDNSFWLYSSEKQELKKVDKNLKTINLTKNIAQILNKNISPIQMIEYANSVYILDEKEGVFIFDLFGNYIKTIPLFGAKRMKIHNQVITYKTNEELILFDLKSFEKRIILELTEKIDDFEITKKGIIGIIGNKTKVFSSTIK